MFLPPRFRMNDNPSIVKGRRRVNAAPSGAAHLTTRGVRRARGAAREAA